MSNIISKPLILFVLIFIILLYLPKEPDLVAIAQREEENHTKAEERYREALRELKSQRLKDHERQSRWAGSQILTWRKCTFLNVIYWTLSLFLCFFIVPSMPGRKHWKPKRKDQQKWQASHHLPQDPFRWFYNQDLNYTDVHCLLFLAWQAMWTCWLEFMVIIGLIH